MPKCCIAGCERDMECPSTGTCKACYQSILNWSKRRSDEIRERQRKVGLYANRMATLAGNISIMTPKKLKLKAMPGHVRDFKVKNGNHKKIKIA